MTGPILIGESNPYGADPEMALYPLPPHASGGRLQRLVMGVRRHRYVEFERHNLCEEPWRIREARSMAGALTRSSRGRVLVLLGRKVAHAFGEKDTPPFSLVDVGEGERYLRRMPSATPPHGSSWTRLLLLPHPSGLNRQWQQPGAVERARRILRVVCPDVPWGEADG